MEGDNRILGTIVLDNCTIRIKMMRETVEKRRFEGEWESLTTGRGRRFNGI